MWSGISAACRDSNACHFLALRRRRVCSYCHAWVLLRFLTVSLLRCAYRGFRISAATLQLTHISKGPIASAYQLHDTSILTVFSHHFVHRDGHDSLLTFFGAGDATSCWSEVDIPSVAWHPVVPGWVIDFSNRDNHKYDL